MMFKSTDFIAVQCFPLCPLECASQKYTGLVSFSDYPTDYGERALLENPIVQKIYSNSSYSTSLRSNVLSLNIYYDKLAFTKVEEFASLDLITLLSNIGGIMGLFLGISVLSFVEIFEILVEIFMILLAFSKNTNRTNF